MVGGGVGLKSPWKTDAKFGATATARSGNSRAQLTVLPDWLGDSNTITSENVCGSLTKC